MHEMSVARQLAAMAQREAHEAGAERVERVFCRIGALRGVEAELLREAFAVAAEGGLCEGAALVIDRAFMTVRCPACGERFEVREWHWACPRCGVDGVEPTGGDELELRAIEVEGGLTPSLVGADQDEWEGG